MGPSLSGSRAAGPFGVLGSGLEPIQKGGRT